MKYLIAHLIKGKPAQFQEKLAREIAEKFHVPFVGERIAPHITFKSPFEAINIKEIELLLAGWARRHSPSKMRLKGFGHFRERVVFIEVLPSSEAGLAVDDLLEDLHFVPWLGWTSTDRLKHFHLTAANLRTAGKFVAIWQFVQNYRPDFEISFDNIALFSLRRNRWHLYKEYAMLGK